MELCELSCVGVPADVNALVVAKGFGSSAAASSADLSADRFKSGAHYTAYVRQRDHEEFMRRRWGQS